MFRVFNYLAGFILLPLLVLPEATRETCGQKVFLKGEPGKPRLMEYVLSNHHARSWMECGQFCFRKDSCVSFNYREEGSNEDVNCQLSNDTCAPTITVNFPGKWTFYGASECCSNPCKNGGKCILVNGEPGQFKCLCGDKYKGKHCESQIVHSSCLSILERNSSAQDGVYRIGINTPPGYTDVYCQMKSLRGCQGGGWTMVMKIDGRQTTFHYDVPYWTNKESFNLPGGLTGLDEHETKLPTYWCTSFTQLCVGMKVGNEANFLSIDYAASSLHSIIADGKYKATKVSREKWKGLIHDSSLQTKCNREGFNVATELQSHYNARLGILGNKHNNCDTAKSLIGFGAKKDLETVCGNLAPSRWLDGSDNGWRKTKAMGYIFVR